jgi:hypothetical protein
VDDEVDDLVEPQTPAPPAVPEQPRSAGADTSRLG